MTRTSVTAAAPVPLRKPILGLMVLALVTLFLTSFAYRATVPASGQAKPQAKGKGPMAAIPALMAKLQENPRDGKTVLDLAEAFMRGRDWQRAEHFYGQAIALDPKNTGAYYHRAIASLELKKFQEALADFESLLAIKPDVAEAHYYIGMLYKYELKNPQSAKEHLQKALDLKPADKEFLAELEKELKTP